MKPVNSLQLNRVAERHWHALEDDLVVGRGHASQRPDGRMFVSVDSWHDAVFHQLAVAMLADLPRPLYTVVDEADLDLATNWRRAGFTTGRREWELVVPTDAPSAPIPAGVRIVPVGAAEDEPLRELDRVIRAEVEAGVGWQRMPAEVLPHPAGETVRYPSKYTVAVRANQYVGLVRVAPLTRQPRIGLIAVRADEQRRGVGRALLTNVLGWLRQDGFELARAEVHQSNAAAMALFDGVGAQPVASNLELVLR
jgi:ribosomal protein S18 acetylase RimI-like enzyme